MADAPSLNEHRPRGESRSGPTTQRFGHRRTARLPLCVVFARRFTKLGQPAWSRASWAVLASVLIVTAWPHLESLSTRLVVSSALSAGLVAAIAHDVRRGPSRASATGGTLDKTGSGG